MTEIAVRQDSAAELPAETEPARLPAPLGAPSALMQWVAEARQVAVIAESLAKTSFVPKPFQGRPAEVTAAILAGQEVGMPPMAALRAIDVIQGKPAMSALAMRGVVQARGHDIWVDESTETRAIVAGRRNGSVEIQRSVWTMDRARRLGLTSKENWKNQPQAMLVARATSECARMIASDALVGMPYSAEELVDDDGAATEAPRPAATTRKARTAKRAPADAVEAPTPDLVPEQDAPDVVEPDQPGEEWPEPAPIPGVGE